MALSSAGLHNSPIKNNNLYRNYWGFARKDRSWKGNASSLEPYKKQEQ